MNRTGGAPRLLTRVALLGAALAASAALAIGLALAGLAPVPAVSSEPAAATAQPTLPVTQIDTVYVVPPTPDPGPPTIVVQKVVTVGGGDDDGSGDQ